MNNKKKKSSNAKSNAAAKRDDQPVRTDDRGKFYDGSGGTSNSNSSSSITDIASGFPPSYMLPDSNMLHHDGRNPGDGGSYPKDGYSGKMGGMSRMNNYGAGFGNRIPYGRGDEDNGRMDTMQNSKRFAYEQQQLANKMGYANNTLPPQQGLAQPRPGMGGPGSMPPHGYGTNQQPGMLPGSPNQHQQPPHYGAPTPMLNQLLQQQQQQQQQQYSGSDRHPPGGFDEYKNSMGPGKGWQPPPDGVGMNQPTPPRPGMQSFYDQRQMQSLNPAYANQV